MEWFKKNTCTSGLFYQELVADFLFVLCKENVNRLIKYTGYGNAAGLLASRGLMGAAQSQGNGGNYSSDDEDSETEEYAMDKSEIDPMIGEYFGSTDGTEPKQRCSYLTEPSK